MSREPGASAWGEGIARLWWHLLPVRRGEVLSRMVARLGSPDAAGLAREMAARLGGRLVRLVGLALRLRLGRPPARGLLWRGRGHLEEATRQGRGVLLLVAHLGPWEEGAALAGLQGYTITVQTRVLKMRPLAYCVRWLRRRCGLVELPERRALRPQLRALRAGGLVAALVDQRCAGREGVEVDFLGAPARASPALAWLASRSGAPVLPVRFRDERGGIVVELGPPLPTPGTGRAAIGEATQRYTDVVAAWVREDPADWLWLHRRWR